MKTSIYGYNYDFVQNNGYFFTISAKNGQSLENHDLVPLQMKMIQSNRIPHLLPIEFEEMDLNVRVHYNITNKRMLTPYLSEKQLTMKEYFSFFLNIITTLEESKLYMLNDRQYVLKEDFIFIGKDIHDIYLTYLPFKNIEGKKDTAEDLKDLLLNLAGEVQGLNGVSFKQILQYLKNPGFNLAGLKEIIIKLQASHISQPPVISQTETATTAYPNGVGNSNVNINHEQAHHKKTHHADVPANNQDEVELKRKRKLPPLSSRERTVSILFAILVIALIWKLYDSFPTHLILYICSSLSVFVILLLIVYIKIWRPGAEKQVLVTGPETHPGKPSVLELAADPAQAIPFYGNGNFYQEMTSSSSHPIYARQSKVPTPQVENDDTVMLGDEGSDAMVNPMGQVIQPRLEIKRDKGIEKVEINKDHFIIGRNADASHFVENTVGVSRVHLEFIQIEGTYGVKDLGSKNGSQLNGDQMVPYKIYALKDKDKISIGKAHYTFRIGL